MKQLEENEECCAFGTKIEDGISIVGHEDNNSGSRLDLGAASIIWTKTVHQNIIPCLGSISAFFGTQIKKSQMIWRKRLFQPEQTAAVFFW